VQNRNLLVRIIKLIRLNEKSKQSDVLLMQELDKILNEFKQEIKKEIKSELIHDRIKNS